MPRVSTITASLNQALKNASQRIVQEAVSELPSNIEMGRVYDEFAMSEYKEDFRSMTLADFVQAVGGAGAAKPAKPAGTRGGGGGRPAGAVRKAAGASFRTRTLEGRAKLDTAVADHLQAVGTAGAEEIREHVGGSAAQVRQSLKRMITEGRVKKFGQKRSTRYTWKGGAAAAKPAARKKTAGRSRKTTKK